jgi:hypothetical protein
MLTAQDIDLIMQAEHFIYIGSLSLFRILCLPLLTAMSL